MGLGCRFVLTPDPRGVGGPVVEFFTVGSGVRFGLPSHFLPFSSPTALRSSGGSSLLRLNVRQVVLVTGVTLPSQVSWTGRDVGDPLTHTGKMSVPLF